MNAHELITFEMAYLQGRMHLFYLHERHAIELLNASLSPDNVYLRLPIMPQLPAGSRVMSIHHDFERRALAVTVLHPSFAPTPRGEKLTCGGNDCELKVVEIRPIEVFNANGTHPPGFGRRDTGEER